MDIDGMQAPLTTWSIDDAGGKRRNEIIVGARRTADEGISFHNVIVARKSCIIGIAPGARHAG